MSRSPETLKEFLSLTLHRRRQRGNLPIVHANIDNGLVELNRPRHDDTTIVAVSEVRKDPEACEKTHVRARPTNFEPAFGLRQSAKIYQATFRDIPPKIH